jgi:vacuolar protein-sorting-associated protein 4
MTAVKYEKNEKVKETIRKKVAEYLDRMEKLKTAIEEGKTNPPKKKASAFSGGGGGGGGDSK